MKSLALILLAAAVAVYAEDTFVGCSWTIENSQFGNKHLGYDDCMSDCATFTYGAGRFNNDDGRYDCYCTNTWPGSQAMTGCVNQDTWNYHTQSNYDTWGCVPPDQYTPAWQSKHVTPVGCFNYCNAQGQIKWAIFAAAPNDTYNCACNHHVIGGLDAQDCYTSSTYMFTLEGS